jgi:hypothetical protein
MKYILYLKGGYANQLFQFMKVLELRSQNNNYDKHSPDKIELHTGLLSKFKTPRSFELTDLLEGKSDICIRRPKSIMKFLFNYLYHFIWGALLNDRYLQTSRTTPTKSIMLNGYFHSPSFLQIPEIANDLINTYYDAELRAQLENKIVVHIRGGDYKFLSQKKSRSLVVLSYNYYYLALSRMTKPLDIIVCTDDIEHSKTIVSCLIRDFPIKNCKIQSDRKIDHKYLFNCETLVCANSSYSLFFGITSSTRFPRKEIIVPKKWFVSDEVSATYISKFEKLVTLI